MDRLKEVVLPDGIGLREIGNGPRHLEDTVVGAGAKMKIIHGMLQEAVAGV